MFAKCIRFTISLALIHAQTEPMPGKEDSINIAETSKIKATTIETMSSLNIFDNTTTLFSNLDDTVEGWFSNGWFSTADTNSDLHIEIAADIEIRDQPWTVTGAAVMGSFYSFQSPRSLPSLSDITYNIRVYYICNRKPGDLVSGAQRFNISTFYGNITEFPHMSLITISISPPIILEPERYFISVQANINDSTYKRLALHRTSTQWVNYGPYLLDNENFYGNCDDPNLWYYVQSCMGYLPFKDLGLALLGPVTTAPTDIPTMEPTAKPTFAPISEPTASPTPSPTTDPTPSPTTDPTAAPSESTPNPTAQPTFEPTMCGDNTNSGPGMPIQCTSDDDCCAGFSCRLKPGPKEGKCGREKSAYSEVLSIVGSNGKDNNSRNGFINILIILSVILNICTLGYCCYSGCIKRWNNRKRYENINVIYENSTDDV